MLGGLELMPPREVFLMKMHQKIIEFVGELVIGQGTHAGEKFTVLPWEKRFIRTAFSTTNNAALSCGRGNGKTVLVAGIACAALVGPLAQDMAEILIVASSFEQGKICFRHILHFLKPWTEAEPKRFSIQDSRNQAQIEDKTTKSRIKVVGSDPRRMHGAQPLLVFADEPAQWPPNTAEKAVSALETSMGKIEGSRIVYLGTKADSSDHWYNRILDDPEYETVVYAAKKDDNPFWKKTWRKANPSLDHFPELERVIRRESRRARRDPRALAALKALRCNMGTPDTVENVLLSADVWQGLEVDTVDGLQHGAYVLGIDLGTTAAMSAGSAFWPDTGALDALAVLPHYPNLQDKGLADGVGELYLRCQERQELFLAGDMVSDIKGLIRLAVGRWGYPGAIVCDRWRSAELQQCLNDLSIPVCPFIERGMGFKDGSEDVRAFREWCLDGKVQAKQSLLLRSAIASARVVIDPAGNAKLAKGREGGRKVSSRDDAVAAAILAVAEGSRIKARQPKENLQYAIA